MTSVGVVLTDDWAYIDVFVTLQEAVVYPVALTCELMQLKSLCFLYNCELVRFQKESEAIEVIRLLGTPEALIVLGETFNA